MTVLESSFVVLNATFVITALVALLVVALIVMVVTVLVRRRTAIATDTPTRAEQKPGVEDQSRRFTEPARDAQASAFAGRVPLLRIERRSTGRGDARSEAFAKRVPLFQVVDRATGEPRPRPRPDPRRKDSLAARWTAALARYDTVMTEWGAIASDPLSALEHSALLDVTQPRTAAFVEALGRAQDRRAVLGSDIPRDRAEVVEFEDLARRVADAWTDVRRHAAHVGYGWMPEKDRALAERADALLRLAADTSASLHERVAAAEQATKVLHAIHAIVLPEPALEVIASQRRLSLEAWQSGGASADGPILSAEPERESRE